MSATVELLEAAACLQYRQSCCSAAATGQRAKVMPASSCSEALSGCRTPAKQRRTTVYHHSWRADDQYARTAGNDDVLAHMPGQCQRRSWSRR